MKKQVSEAKAKKVLEAVQKMYHESHPLNGPQLRMDFDWFGTGAHPAIVWEGGPYDWSVAFSLSSDDLVPKGVFIEAMTSWAIGIYPDS